MLLHAIQMTAAFAGFDDVTRNGLVPIGSFGVDIFFVLSGVVIAMLVARNGPNPQTPGGFAFRRAAKLLPTFWVTLALMVLILQAPPSGFPSPLSLLLLEPQSIHVPAWTLLFEAHFYLVAAVALCFPARAMTVMLIWVPLQVAAVGLATAQLIPMQAFLRPPSLELCAGLLIGIAAPRWRMPMPAVAAFGAIGLVLIEATLFPNLGNGDANPMRLPMYGIPAGLLVYALLSLERAGWKPPRLAVALGEISFSLYMWHIPVMLLLAIAMLGCKDWPLGVPAYGVLSIALSIWVASAAYRVIEAPITDWANRLTRREKPTASVSGSGAVRQGAQP